MITNIFPVLAGVLYLNAGFYGLHIGQDPKLVALFFGLTFVNVLTGML